MDRMDALGRICVVLLVCASTIASSRAQTVPPPATTIASPAPATQPLFRSVELDVGESRRVVLSDRQEVDVKLIAVHERRDSLNRAVRSARVEVELNGRPVTLWSENYHLPLRVGSVQIDCPCTAGYIQKDSNPWALGKAVRLRLWPAGSPWMRPGTFAYPIRQALFASDTQMGNEPVFVDGGEVPDPRRAIYYHRGLDFGGAEGMVEVVAATEGTVVSAGTESAEYPDFLPVKAPRYDAILIHGRDGWYYRYSHLQSIDAAIQVGQAVRMGQLLGVLGKEGTSGGWAHLHFEAFNQQPSGQWGSEAAYAFVWEAYLREQKPDVVAVARPHHVAAVGETVTLDGTRSWSSAGRVARYEWICTDGYTSGEAIVERVYTRPGTYSEILKASDQAGRFDYDFAVVQVLDPAAPDRLPPTIHAAFAPTTGVRPGDPITFEVRTFRCTDGEETWNFGDGSAPVIVKSDGNAVKLAKDGYAVTTHAFAEPGDYLVSVQRTDRWGQTAVGRLHVRVRN